MFKKTIMIEDEHEPPAQISCSIPNECPWCHNKILPILIASSKTDIINNQDLQISLLLRCTSCYKHFMQNYDTTIEINHYSRSEYILTGLELNTSQPKPISTFSYPPEIDLISIEFKNIIAQSTEAEGLGLNHLAGIGYRKALEYLVKDFLINSKNADAEKISNKSLYNCIQQDIEDDRIKSLAKAATWIGNDETHYVRKHENHTIEDMKNFMHAMTYYISLEVSLSEARDLTEQ